MDEVRFEGAISGFQFDLGPGTKIVGNPPEAEYLDVVAHLACRAREGRLHVYFLGRTPERWPDNFWLPGHNVGVLYRPMSEADTWLTTVRSPEAVNLILDGRPPFNHRLALAFHPK